MRILPPADALNDAAGADCAANRRLDLLTRHSTDVLVELHQGRITYVSPNAMYISGRRPEDFVGLANADIVHPDDLVVLSRFFAPGWTGPIEATFRVRDVANEWRWRDVRGARVIDERGEHRAVLVLRDIHDRKLAEDAFLEGQRRSEALLRAIPDLMFRMNRDGVYLDFKADHAEDLYVVPELIVGANVSELLPTPLGAAIQACIHRALDTGEMQTIQYSLLKHDGLRDYESRITPCGADEVVVIARDVTQRKAAERRAREADEERAVHRERARIAQELHDTVAQFFFTIGIASTELLERKTTAPALLRRRLARIRSLSAEGGREIRNAIQALTANGAAEDLDVSIPRLLEPLSASGVAVSYDQPQLVPKLPQTVQRQMFAAAREALFNVRKHAAASRVDVRIVTCRESVTLIIADDGAGSADALAQATQRNAGFGLTNLRACLEAMGGRLDVRDGTERGVEIRCVLPLEAA